MKKKFSKIVLASALSLSALGVGAVADVPVISSQQASAAMLYGSNEWGGKSLSLLQSNGNVVNNLAPYNMNRGSTYAWERSYEYRDMFKDDRIFFYRVQNGVLSYVTSTTLTHMNDSTDWPIYKHTVRIPTTYAAGTYVAVKNAGYDSSTHGYSSSTDYLVITVY